MMMGERGEKRILNLNRERKKEEVCRSEKGKSERRNSKEKEDWNERRRGGENGDRWGEINLAKISYSSPSATIVFLSGSLPWRQWVLIVECSRFAPSLPLSLPRHLMCCLVIQQTWKANWANNCFHSGKVRRSLFVFCLFPMQFLFVTPSTFPNYEKRLT